MRPSQPRCLLPLAFACVLACAPASRDPEAAAREAVERLVFPGQPVSEQHGKFVARWLREDTRASGLGYGDVTPVHLTLCGRSPDTLHV